jgi:hypothetical protein
VSAGLSELTVLPFSLNSIIFISPFKRVALPMVVLSCNNTSVVQK